MSNNCFMHRSIIAIQHDLRRPNSLCINMIERRYRSDLNQLR